MTRAIEFLVECHHQFDWPTRLQIGCLVLAGVAWLVAAAI